MHAFNLTQNQKLYNTALKICRFFRQSVAKIMGKTAIWTISCLSPLLPLNNVEEQWAKFASSNVMGSQHCREGEGEF